MRYSDNRGIPHIVACVQVINARKQSEKLEKLIPRAPINLDARKQGDASGER